MNSSHARVTIAALLAAATAMPAAAQSLANRLSNAPEGLVQFSFPARPGVCGNGRTYISTAPGSFSGTFNSSIDETIRREPCEPGPVRVVLNRAGREVVSLETFAGPPAPVQGTDLGTVSAQEAADWLLGLAARGEGKPSRDAIFPATLAEGANTHPALLAIARDQARPRETRRSAISHLGRAGSAQQGSSSAQVSQALVAIARDRNDDQQVRQQAVSVLSRMERGEGIPALIQLSGATDDTWLARQSVSSLARSGDPRARTHLRTVLQRGDLAEDVQVSVVRGLGGSYATAQDAEFLRTSYARLNAEKAREAVISTIGSMAGTDNTRWMMSVARNDSEPVRLRRMAARAAHKAGVPMAELVALYDATQDTQMKETLIGVYAESTDRAAVDKLISIARNDPNHTLRKRAVSRLSRNEDPRVREALRNLVEG